MELPTLMEILTTIALLCASPAYSDTRGRGYPKVEHLKCQKYYIKCVGNTRNNLKNRDKLEDCVLNRMIGVKR